MRGGGDEGAVRAERDRQNLMRSREDVVIADHRARELHEELRVPAGPSAELSGLTRQGDQAGDQARDQEQREQADERVADRVTAQADQRAPGRRGAGGPWYDRCGRRGAKQPQGRAGAVDPIGEAGLDQRLDEGAQGGRDPRQHLGQVDAAARGVEREVRGVVVGRQSDHDHAEAVEVGGRQRLTQDLLRGHVAEGPRAGHRARLAQRQLDGAEVDQREPVRREQEVLRRDVAVQHRRDAGVQIFEDLEALLEDRPQLLRGQHLLAIEQVLQARRVDQGLDEDEAAALLVVEVVEVARDRRMLEAGEHPGLALEQLDGLPVARAGQLELLEEHQAEPAAARAIGQARGPLGERRVDVVGVGRGGEALAHAEARRYQGQGSARRIVTEPEPSAVATSRAPSPSRSRTTRSKGPRPTANSA